MCVRLPRSFHTVLIKWKGPFEAVKVPLVGLQSASKGKKMAKGWGERDQEMYKQRFHLRGFRYLRHSVHVRAHWQRPLCTHQLAGSIMKPKHQNCAFFFPRQLTKMIQSNLLSLIGKVLAPALHGKICIPFFEPVPTLMTLFLSWISLKKDKHGESKLSSNVNFERLISNPRSLTSEEPKLKPFSHFTPCKLSPQLHHSLIGDVNCFSNGFSWT